MNILRAVSILIAGVLFDAAAGLAAASENAPAQTYYLFVLNDAAPGQEYEFNRWYDQQHAQDVLINPGYLDSQRYVASERQLRPDARVPNKYAIKFRIVTQDIARSLEYIHDNIRSGLTVPTKSIARGPGGGGDFVYRVLTDVMPGSAAGGGNSATTKYLYMEFSTATEARQRQFNDWYNNVHAPKIAALAGVRQWQRFELSAVQLTQRKISDVEQYLAMYDIEVSGPATLDRLQQHIEALAAAGPPDELGKIGASYTYRGIGPLLSGDQVKKERGVRSQ